MAETGSWRTFDTSGGVALRYGPFPGGMYWEVMGRALRDHPDPTPPRRQIDTVTGPEEVDDLEDPGYRRDLAAAQEARWDLMGKFILEFCVEIEDEGWTEVAARLRERYAVDVPEGGPDLKVWYLGNFVLRTPEDWGIIRLVQRFSQVEEEEVAQRVDFFRGDVEGPEGAGADAPGPAAV